MRNPKKISRYENVLENYQVYFRSPKISKSRDISLKLATLFTPCHIYSLHLLISDTSAGRAGVSRGDMIGQNGMATAVNASQPNTANSSPNPRTLLGRLGIRKPSLFSLTGPLQPAHTARTFSLDDLFKSSSSSKTNPVTYSLRSTFLALHF